MKKQINKKRPVFTAIIIVVSILFFDSGCSKTPQNPNPDKTTKIIYTDVNPDSVIIKYRVRNQYHLDLDNDGVADFIIGYDYIQNRCGGEGVANKLIEYIDTAVGANNQVLDENGVDTLNNSFAINADGQWSTNAGLNLLVVTNSQGTCPWGTNHFNAWYNVTDKYLGLRFIKAGNTYYGWARFTSSGISLTNFNDYALTLKDYAYNSIPNQPILAGQTK